MSAPTTDPTTARAPADNRLSLGQFVAGVRTVARRELSAYFDSPIAYVVVIAFALLANSIFMNEFFLAGRLEMDAYFDALPLLLAVFLPAITMRLWAEERQRRTIEFLLTLPIRASQAVVGKYLAAASLLVLLLASSLPIPLMLQSLGEPDLGRIFAGYLGALLFGGLLLSLGELLSALASDQIVAFVTTVLAGFALVLLGDERVTSVLDGLAPGLHPGSFLYETVAATPRYELFTSGIVDSAGLIYFVGLTAACLGLGGVVLTRSRG